MLMNYKGAGPAGRKMTPAELGQRRALAREPCSNEPLCSTCAWADAPGPLAPLVCWARVHAVSGHPVDCSTARSLDGFCGPFGKEWRPIGDAGPAVNGETAICVDCRHHELDASAVQPRFDVDLCGRFPDPGGALGLCHELRSSGGACGLAGSGFERRHVPEDFISAPAVG